jgi:2-polyprenyl-3-methyl-5-hydroxy-6-metoxy-1,4-benzoquinol methylase
MAVETFEEFIKANSLYGMAFGRLDEASRLLATSAQLVYELHPTELGPVVNDILPFVQHAYSDDYIGTYISRVSDMARLQEIFDANPSSSTLSDGSVVPTEAYSLSLLLSIIFTNHRFEIMQTLEKFLQGLAAAPEGRIASIGCGTGYELKLTAKLLPGWSIEGYDIDEEMRAEAQRFLQFSRVSKAIHFAEEFPLHEPTQQVAKRYDAIIVCEVLEHLHEPALALTTLRECLNDQGVLFVTMAINLAQEDHIFLYPDVDSCRRQIHESGLEIHTEYLTPQTIRFPPPDREIGFKKGNYVAIVGKRKEVRGS